MTTLRHFTIIEPDDVPFIWHEVRPLIEKALEYNYLGSMTSADALRLVLNHRQQLWLGVENPDNVFLALLTEIVPYPRHSVLRIITFATKTGHDMDSWYHYLSHIEDFGRANKCTALEAWTRKGLAEKLNWEHEYAVITKNIKPKQPRKRRRRTKTNG